MKLEGKVALVTGASRGIGRGTAICLAEHGADIVVNYRKCEDEAQQTAAAVAALGRRALVVQADVSDRDAVAAMFDQAIGHFGHIDIAVANAAYTGRGPIVDLDWEEVSRTIEVSQYGVFHTCQFAARQMVAQAQAGEAAGGKIIIISSLHEQLPVKGSAPYNMAKAAINHLGRTLAAELAGHHINVNTVNPGWIETEASRSRFDSAGRAEIASKIPWKRTGTVADVGNVVAFLCSDDAVYITGATIPIDGGYMVGLGLTGDTGWVRPLKDQ